jgi:hypothetical protein
MAYPIHPQIRRFLWWAADSVAKAAARAADSVLEDVEGAASKAAKRVKKQREHIRGFDRNPNAADEEE